MNSLAHADEREQAFVGAIEPLPGSVFHNKGELLWMVKYYLDNNKQDPNAPDELYGYLRSQLEIRRTGYEEKSKAYSGFLYPTPGSPDGDRLMSFHTAWNDLARAIEVAAERRWRDTFLNDASDEDIRERLRSTRGSKEQQYRAAAEVGLLELLCQKSNKLMHLYVQTILFRTRAMQNASDVRAGWTILRPHRRTQTIEGQIEKVIAHYYKTLGSWEREIRRVTGLHVFGLQYGDVLWLRALGKEFGPSSAHIEESGWIMLAPKAETELRYQYLKAQMLENWKSHRLTAVAYWLADVMTRFGTRPRRLVPTALTVIMTFSLLYFLSDWSNPGLTSANHFCAGNDSANMTWWQLVAKYVYITLANLISFGSGFSGTKLCDNTISHLLALANSIIGYFVLAILAALVFQVISLLGKDGN